MYSPSETESVITDVDEGFVEGTSTPPEALFQPDYAAKPEVVLDADPFIIGR